MYSWNISIQKYFSNNFENVEGKMSSNIFVCGHINMKRPSLNSLNTLLKRGEQGKEDGGQGDPSQGGREGAAACA